MKKKRYYWLWIAIMISTLLVTGIGIWMKYLILMPQGLYQDKNVVEIVMLYLGDQQVRNAVHGGKEDPVGWEPSGATDGSTDQPAAQPTTEPAAHPTTEVTDAPTEPGPTPMDDAWFEDVLFIGDSRTVALRDLARSGNAQYFCSVGMTVFEVTKTTASDKDFSEQTLEQLLSSRSYGKVFIALGINECGYSLQSFLEAYQNLIDLIHEKQPAARIILQSIMTVGKRKAAEEEYFSIANIRKFNEGISTLADGESIFYIDVNEEFADEEGYLPSEMSSDGCHLYGKYDVLWEKWIRRACDQLEI